MSIQGDTCFAQADTTPCSFADFAVDPANFDMARSTGEAILIIDGFGSGFFPELVRYRNRLRGFYSIDGDQLTQQVLSVHLPERLGNALTSFAGPEFVPASALASVASAVNERYGKLNLLSLGHGGAVFGFLAELVPEQPLVLLELTGLLDIPQGLCHGIDDASLAAATAHFTAVAGSLRQVMTNESVRFINASFGSTTAVLPAIWQRDCPGTSVPGTEQLQQILHIYDPFYGLLFRSDGVIAAHAAANLGSPVDFPFDQVNAQYPNQVRAGFISSLNSGLDESGRGTVQKTEQFPDTGSADVYLNWDCEGLDICADPHYQVSAAFGLAMANVLSMSSSDIAPLALARLINLRYGGHAAEPMTDDLVRALQRELTPALCGNDGAQPCVYQDPIPHRQLEIYRLHYQ